MISREDVLKQTEQAAQRAGRFRYLKKNAVTNLRVLEYDNTQGNRVFAQQLIEHRRVGQGGKSIGICRKEIFDLPCAFCRLNEMARNSGTDAPFVSRSRYIMNALDIDNDPKTVRLYTVPTTVFSAIADYALDEEWADVLEAKKGCAFSIGRKGELLDTEYTIKPQRKSYPIGKAVTEQVVDPITEIRDSGAEAQCAEIGASIDELFEPDEIEEIKSADKERTGRKGKSSSASGKASKLTAPKFNIGDAVRYKEEEGTCEVTGIDGDDFEVKDENGTLWTIAGKDLDAAEPTEPEPEPEAIGFEIGAAVYYKDEKDVCHISKIDGNDIEIEDGSGDLFDVELADLTAVETTEPVAKKSKKSKKKKAADDDAPKCFGDPNLYDAGDDECKKCEYFGECGGNTELNAAGVGNNRVPMSKGKRTADDIVADIIGSRKRRR